MTNKAVVLGNNYYIGLSAIRCLGEENVPVVTMDYDSDELYGVTSKYCDEIHLVPHYREDTEGFIQYLEQYARRQEKKPVLIPTHDSYVEVIDEHLEELRELYHIPQTEKGLYTELMNKDTLAALAIEHGVKVPETIYVDDENFHEKVEEIIKFPCLVKPVDSPSFVAKFRKKLFKVHSMEELKEAIKLAEEAELEVIVQRIIPGFDDHMYTFDAYLNQKSKVTHWVTCQKYRQYPINYGASVYTIQRHVPEVYELGKKFLESVKYKGFAEIEFKKDSSTGEFYLIEVNVRITNFNSLLCKLGMNFPYITYRELTGSPLEPKAITENTNKAFWYFYEDMLAVKDYIKTRQLSFPEVFRPMFRSKAYAIWDWKDIRPGISYNKIMFRKLLAKLFRR